MLLCWRRLLRVPWTAMRSIQSNIKDISPEYSLEGLMLKLQIQYFGHLMWRTDSLEKTLMLGKKAGGEADNRVWDDWMASLTQWTWVWINSWSWWWTGRPGVLQSMWSQRVGHNWVTELNIKYKHWVRATQRLWRKEVETEAHEWRQRAHALFEILGPIMSEARLS